MLQVSRRRLSSQHDLRLWGLNGGVLVLSFLLSGLANVIPQFALLQLAPEHKAIWLPISLLAGTASAMVGTVAGGAYWERAVSNRWVIAPLLGTAFGFLGLFLCREPGLFVALHAGVSGLGNLLVTRFDHLATRMAADAQRRFNDRLGTACRLLGMLLAPWFFTHQLQHVPAIAMVLGLSLGCSAWALAIGWGESSRPFVRPVAPATNARLAVADWLLIGHAVTVYAALYLFAANLSYFLRDALGMESATPRAGILIVAVFLAAFAAVTALPLLPGMGGLLRGGSRLALWPVAPVLVALVVQEAHVAVTFAGMLAIAVALGGAYGCFLLCLRDFVSRSVAAGKGQMLTLYNNLANASALVAFLAMLALARLEPGSSAAYYDGWLRLLAVTALTGVPLLLLARHFPARHHVLGESRP